MAAKRRKKPKSQVTLPYTGDHGPNTAAATRGTELIPIEGQEHNRTARRQRICVLDKLHHRYGTLDLRQYQAGMEILSAYAHVEKLSSGGPLKEQVDNSPRPDAVVASQVDAQSRLHRAMGAVPDQLRFVVEHVCWYNRPLSMLPRKSKIGGTLLKLALERVANRLGY